MSWKPLDYRFKFLSQSKKKKIMNASMVSANAGTNLSKEWTFYCCQKLSQYIIFNSFFSFAADICESHCSAQSGITIINIYASNVVLYTSVECQLNQRNSLAIGRKRTEQQHS